MARGSASYCRHTVLAWRVWLGVRFLRDRVPLYDDLIRRAVEAKEQANFVVGDSLRLAAISQALRDAHHGRAMLVRRAWCEALKIGGEWLNLAAVGKGQQRITAEVRAGASHGICPRCLEEQMHRSATERIHTS